MQEDAASRVDNALRLALEKRALEVAALAARSWLPASTEIDSLTNEMKRCGRVHSQMKRATMALAELAKETELLRCKA